ncbi:hypothetical protein CRUP_002683 [Coryphaenoides rupestris]|nr:hypothetical protein CRUP_002683 [Coryphaenoides rupestris]
MIDKPMTLKEALNAAFLSSEQEGDFLVRTHHVEYCRRGILDPDDILSDLVGGTRTSFGHNNTFSPGMLYVNAAISFLPGKTTRSLVHKQQQQKERRTAGKSKRPLEDYCPHLDI